MNIKEQLDKWIELLADKYEVELEKEIEFLSSNNIDHRYTDSAICDFKAGANEMKDLLLIAVEALEGIAKSKCSGADVYGFADAAKFDSTETLKQIQEKIKGE